MKKLDNRDLYNLDQELLNFRRINQAIWTRKAELMAKNGDDLVGGGKYGNSNPTENTVMKFATDVTLKNLELFKETVESLKKQLTGEQLDIFYLRWGQANLDWEEIAEKKFFSSSTIYRKRRHILETYAVIKGIL